MNFNYFKILLILLGFKTFQCQAQMTQGYYGHYLTDVKHKADTIVDKLSSVKFILDSSGIYVSAIDIHGKLLWKTDPWKDNHIEVYRTKRPLINYMSFEKNENTNNLEVIGIVYNNSQFGYLNEITGEFTMLGQD